MLTKLKKIFSAGPADAPEQQADVASIAPERLLLAVGDIHGCYDLLRDALQRADAFVESNDSTLQRSPQLVLVGDYIDRGERSADVLNWVFDLSNELPDNVICLMGNHERMLLDFLDDPAGRGHRWLRNGGLQTLASYRVGGVHERSDVEDLTEASARLEAAMPPGLVDWMRTRPLYFQSGNVCITHAAMDPELGPNDQPAQAMLWGHKDFLRRSRRDGLWVVHGHTIVPEPQIAPSRIAIDTGAYHSGQLTVAAIGPGFCQFL